MFACPSVRISALPTRQISVKFYTGGILRKSINKIQIWLKSNRNIGPFFTKTMMFYLYRRHTKFATRELFCCTPYFYVGWEWNLYPQNTQENALLRLHCNNGHANAQQCFFIRSFFVLICLNPVDFVAYKTCRRLKDNTPFYTFTSFWSTIRIWRTVLTQN